MNANGRFGGLLKNHGVSLVIGAATAGFAAHLNSSVTHIHNNVSTIQTTVSAQDAALARSIAALQDTLNAIGQRFEEFQGPDTSRYHTLWTAIKDVDNAVVTLQDTLEELPRKVDDIDRRATTKAKALAGSLDNLHDTVHAHAKRFRRKAIYLEQAVRKVRRQNENIHSVRIYVGAEKPLKDCGILKTSGFLCCKKYKIKSFPDTGGVRRVKDTDHVDAGKVMAVRIDRSFTVSGKVAALCGFHGKLRKGKDYTVRTEQGDTTRVTFSRSTMAGQRILVVLK